MDFVQFRRAWYSFSSFFAFALVAGIKVVPSKRDSSSSVYKVDSCGIGINFKYLKAISHTIEFSIATKLYPMKGVDLPNLNGTSGLAIVAWYKRKMRIVIRGNWNQD